MLPITSTDAEYVEIKIKEFLIHESCPKDWEMLDIYLLRDGEIVFYVGQSERAFDRVWQHIRDGYKGQSKIGRFILCNWPLSMNFTLELHSSHSLKMLDLAQLTSLVGINPALPVEKALIEKYSPCFNHLLNPDPTPLPGRYSPTTAPLTHARSLKKIIRESRYHVQAEQRQSWLKDAP